MTSQQGTLQEADEEHERRVLEVTPDNSELRTGDQAYEAQEATATCVAAVTDASEAKACAPQKLGGSILHSAGDECGSASPSDSSCYSPLKPFDLKFSSPDLEKYKNPFKDCPGVYRSPDISQYVDSSPEFTPPPVTSKPYAEMNVAIPLPNSPAHNTNAPEPRRSAENFYLPCSVTLRRRRATKNMSPLALSEFSPIHPTKHVELNPEQATEDEAEESESDEGPWNTAPCSGRAPTVPKFMSPDMKAYPRLIREDIAKCYDAHREWPSSLMDSPASTVSAASDEHNVASSPPAGIPMASKSTLDQDFAGLSAYNPSPISRPMLDAPHRLSTVTECTETSIKGEDESGFLHELDRLMALLNEEQAAGAGLTATSPQATAEEPAQPISPIPRVESRTPPLPCTRRRSSRSPRPGVPSIGELIEASQAGPTEPPAGAEPEWRTAEDKLEEAVPVFSGGWLPVAASAPLLEPDVNAAAQPPRATSPAAPSAPRPS